MTLAVALTLWAALVILVGWAVRQRPRDTTYVCRACHAGFSSPDAAFRHWEAMHEHHADR